MIKINKINIVLPEALEFESREDLEQFRQHLRADHKDGTDIQFTYDLIEKTHVRKTNI